MVSLIAKIEFEQNFTMTMISPKLRIPEFRQKIEIARVSLIEKYRLWIISIWPEFQNDYIILKILFRCKTSSTAWI